MPELHNLEDHFPRPRRPMSPLWSSNLIYRPSRGDKLSKKIAKKNETETKLDAASKKTCICAPTNHAGSFRCHLHRATQQQHYQWPQEDGGNGREVTSVKVDLPRFHFANNKVPESSRFGRASIASKN